MSKPFMRTMRRAAVLAGLAGLLSARAALAGNDGPSNAQVVANLMEIVFGSEFVGEDSTIVRKWRGPMRLAVYAMEPERYRDLIEPHLAHLRRLTGLDIELVDNSAPGQNAYVFVFGRAQFYDHAARHLGPGKNPRTNRYLECFGYFHPNGNQEIDEITAVMPNFMSDEGFRACVVEELTQAIGLPNDSNDVSPSIFNDDNEFRDLTWQDELFLRVLYDPRVKPGMRRAEFEPLAARIVEELRPGR